MSRLEISTSIEFRNGVGRANHFDRVRNDVNRTAALYARRLVGIEHVHRDVDANARAFRHTQKIDMHWQILDRVELKVARDHPMFGAIHIEIVQRGEETPGIDALAQFVVVDQDHHRGFVLSIDHARHSAGATRSPGGPLAAFRTRRRLQFVDGRHFKILF